MAGGSAWRKWKGGHFADMRVERVEEPTVFGFTWRMAELPEGWTRELGELVDHLDAAA